MKGLITYSALIVAVGLGYMTSAMAYEEGTHYQKLPAEVLKSEFAKEIQAKEKDKVIVLEFFSYGCNWCYKIEPLVENFKKTLPSNVFFMQIPVEFQQSWGALTKAYYTAHDLKVLNAVHEPLFEAIQTEKLTTATPEVLGTFFAYKGVKKADFDTTYTSFNVDNQHKWANEMTRAYKITAVPVIVVQGPKEAYMTSVRMAGSDQDLFRVVDELVKKQAAALPKVEKTEKAGNTPTNRH